MMYDRMEPLGLAGRGQFVSGVLLGLGFGFAAAHALIFAPPAEEAQSGDVAIETVAWDALEFASQEGTPEGLPVETDFSALEVDSDSEPGWASLSDTTAESEIRYFPESMPPAKTAHKSSANSQLAFVEDGEPGGAFRVTADITSDEDDVPQALQPEPTAAPIDQQTSQREELTRRLIQDELPNATKQERDVWYDVLLGLPAEDVRGVLRMRKRLGSGNSLALSNESGLDPSEFLLRPAVQPPNAGTLLTSPRVIQERRDENLATLRQLQELDRQNLLNRETIAYKQVVPLVTENGASAKTDGNKTLPSSSIRCLGVIRDMSAGSLRSTGRLLDVGIDPDASRVAFFQVRRGDDVCYTRAGRLGLDGNGRLTLLAAADPWLLDPPILIPSDAADVVIETDGHVKVASIGTDEASEEGRIAAVLFLNPEELKSLGDGLYQATAKSGHPVVTSFGATTTGALLQGHVESSNVDDAVLHARMTWQQSMLDLLVE